jgi:hypothetical protein
VKPQEQPMHDNLHSEEKPIEDVVEVFAIDNEWKTAQEGSKRK